jgi:hypothetical protein
MPAIGFWSPGFDALSATSVGNAGIDKIDFANA